MGLLLNLVAVALFAFVARALLAAWYVSWPRLLLAAGIGFVVGLAIGGLVLSQAEGIDVTELDAPTAEFYAAALPFQLVITMAVVVGFELVRTTPARRARLRHVRPLRALRRRLSIMWRWTAVTRVATRHGLGVSSLRPTDGSEYSPDLAPRLRAAIEEVGGVYVKLGQLLASRPDLVPPEVVDELSHLHAEATPLPIEQVRRVLEREIGDVDQVFMAIDPEPLGSASIAQAHSAVLRDGTAVVVKVQRPGLEDDVERDLAILAWAARTAERRFPEMQAYGVAQLSAEFAQALRGELDFRNEARQVAAMADAVRGFDLIRVPRVFDEFTTPQVLVMERLDGRPLAVSEPLPPDHADVLADALCTSQIQAMIRGNRFHGDPHPGNVLLLTDGRLGLIDFGLTGRLDSFGRGFVLELLAALKLQDPALIYEALLTGGSVHLGEDRERVERALAAFMAAHVGPQMLSAGAITQMLRLTADLGFALPAQAAVTFRAVATLTGTLETLSPGYPFIHRLTEIAGLEARARMQPANIAELWQRELGTLGPFARRLPRQVDRIAAQLGRGSLTTRVRLFAEPADVAVAERLLNKALLSILSLGILSVSILLLRTEAGPLITDQGPRLTELLGWTGLFAGTVLVLRALLGVLRHRPERPLVTRRETGTDNDWQPRQTVLEKDAG